MMRRNGQIPLITVSSLLIFSVLFLIYILSGKRNAITVYCAHDSVYAEKILRKFQQESGIDVITKFDTEATKSIGLIELIKRESGNPRCDLFWNNEILGTMELKKDGLLEPYKGAGYMRIPEKFKDPDGYWTGFAARLRVSIINIDLIPSSQITGDEIREIPAKFAIAKPLYGTTLTHFTCIAREKGMQGLEGWYHNIKKQGVKILNGNAAVKDAVAFGGCSAGWSDTDDFFAAKSAGRNVEMRPVKLENGETISIPNTIAIIAGTKHLEKAKKLADFLLSERCELMLANSKSHQIPLGDVDSSKIPKEVIQLKEWSKRAFPLTEDLLYLRKKCIEFLKTEL
jgi:iron(III) transport system substrate-binding protein